ncbi:protein eyes shut homolog [Salmo salar]|uniref:Protein eyes shut homolog n=1 Tax=Salmo salar TaxID=8030 RepID=A0ABM3D6E8_SALSA|nr:protein eyes shut homolog [Salmo salar]
MIEIAVDNRTVKRQEESLFQPVSEVALGPIFLGDVPSHRDQPASTREVTGFVGCIRELQVNNKDIYIAGEALGGRNIHNCDTPVCQHLPCRNGGTCVSWDETVMITLTTTWKETKKIIRGPSLFQLLK